MDNTPYSVLYESVLSKITSYDFLAMTDKQIESVLKDYVRPAVVAFNICKKDLSLRDDVNERFEVRLNDQEIEILSNHMVIAYLDANYIRVPLALKQQLSSKDFNTYSPANHLKEIMNVRETYRKELDTLLIKYSFRKGV